MNVTARDMLEGGARHRELEQQVLQSRTASVDGRSVVYNLTRGVDFSHPRATAGAVAQVLWDQDVHDWWSVDEDVPSCTPTSTVEIWIPQEHNRKVEKAVDEFKHDLRDEELAPHFADFLNHAENYSIGWGTIFLTGPMLAAVMEGSENKARRQAALEQLFSQMSGHIRVVPR